MAHYAFLNENNVVVEVITGIDENETIEGLDPETWYGQLRGKACKRTSYNTHGGTNESGVPFRKNYASIGYTYDPVRDAFIPPAPGGNYAVDEDTCLWVRIPELGIVSGDAIITADGVDFALLYIAGAVANSAQTVTVNGDPLEVTAGDDGYVEFEISSETPGLLTIEWNGVVLEVAAV